MAAILLAGLGTGCGSAFSEILFQAASAAGRSALDVALTDLANDLADAADQQGDDGVDDDGAVDDDPGDSDDSPPDDSPVDDGGGDLAGDAATGEAVFVDNGCTSCHCADASGGCALSAPGLAGVSRTELESRLTGELSHPIQADLTAQEFADLEAFLASVGG